MELQGKHIAILTENVYEDLELHYPRLRMLEAGATVHLLGAGDAVYHGKHGLPAEPDGQIDDARAEDYDAVIVPGGYSPDKMRAHPPFIEFVRQMAAQDKLVAFICHAGWVPASAGILKGRRVTSYATIKDDLVHAGAEWVDEEVVQDGKLISSRTPADLPAFCRAIIAALAD
ncbi:MAG: type 1 glutamine amidotransferase domain-containing protein [Pseudomonadota bacterium]|nr:type 1 glutamine amidotransferase domain-containing protein [Pseudomonadota bacterium]